MNINQCISIISNIDLFSSFNQEELVRLFKTSPYKIRHYKKGQVIHFQNELCLYMDIVLIGQVFVQNIDKEGNILTVSTFSPSDIMGVNLLFSSKNYFPMTVSSKSDALVLHINKNLVLQLCQDNMEFLTKLIRVISDKTLTLTNKINSISLKTIRQSIIDFLVYEYHIQKTNVIQLSTSKKEMAERLGVQRPSLMRELNKMRKDNLLEYDAKTITITDLCISTYLGITSN